MLFRSPVPLEASQETAIRYLGDEGGRAFVASMEGHENVLFVIRPDRWLTADYSGGV